MKVRFGWLLIGMAYRFIRPTIVTVVEDSEWTDWTEDFLNLLDDLFTSDPAEVS